MVQQLQQNQMNSYGYLPQNLLVNPGFEIWQRGAGSFTGDGAITADEWQMDFSTGPMSVDRNSSPKFGTNCAEISAPDNSVLRQGIEAYKSLESLSLTFSAWIKTSTSNAALLRLRDYDGSTVEIETGAYHTGSGDWEHLTVTKVIRTGLQTAAGITHGFGLSADLRFDAACTAYIDGASLVIGNYPEGVPFIPLNLADDWSRCQRFYEKLGRHNGGEYMSISGYGTSGDTYKQSIGFSTLKSAVPTVTKAGAWPVTNCGQPAINSIGMDGFVLSASITSNGLYIYYPNTTNDYVEAEVT